MWLLATGKEDLSDTEWLIHLREGVTFSNGTLVYVSNSYGAPLYNAPRSDAGWICTIPAGTVLESYSTTSNGFLLVSYANWEGYVDKYCLSLY